MPRPIRQPLIAFTMLCVVCLAWAGCSPDGNVTSGTSNGRRNLPRGSDAGSFDASSSDPTTPGAAREERCGNGLDDDRDGLVDEQCPCNLGEQQACWPGDPSRRGQGSCQDGMQQCEDGFEFPQWGPCEGAVLPSEEIPGNYEDEDCDGVADGAPMCTPGEFGEVCTGGEDEDCDGKIDCEDPDCERSPACRDDCSTPGACDCAPRETNCRDGVDDDCDGNTDCTDVDCQRCTPGAFRWCDEPSECAWGRQQCQPDGTWGPCTEVSPPPGCEGTSVPLIGTINEYDRECCIRQGLCCQNYGGSGDPDRSVGNCDGVVQCLM